MHPLLRYTLDLFGAVAPAPAPSTQGRVVRSKPTGARTPGAKPLKAAKPPKVHKPAPPLAPKVPQTPTPEAQAPRIAAPAGFAGPAPTGSARPQAGAPSDAPQFAHPQASRQLHLGGVLVAYALARGQRRTIGMANCTRHMPFLSPTPVTIHDDGNMLRGI